MTRSLVFATIIYGLAVNPTQASMIAVTATQTGGFFDSGVAPDNSPAFQNYFVGYGTSPGSPRTEERRSFFIFDLGAVDAGTVVGATIELRLPFGGLIFGKSGDPMTGPVPSPDDPFEEFALGVSTKPTSMVTSLGLTPPMIDEVFESFNDIPVAATTVFTPGFVAGLPSDMFGTKIVIPLDAMGIAALNFKAGSTIVLTGWMPSWTFDTRMAPGGGPYEASELIFGLTDVHFPPPPGVPPPVLTLDLSEAVPEPTSWGLLLVGVSLAGGLRLYNRRRTMRDNQS